MRTLNEDFDPLSLLTEEEFNGADRAAAGIGKVVDLATKATIAIAGKLKKTRDQKAAENELQKKVAVAAGDENYPNMAAEVLLDTQPEEADILPAFDFVSLEELQAFQVYLNTLNKNLGEVREGLAKSVARSDLLPNTADRNVPHIQSILEYKPQALQKLQAHYKRTPFSKQRRGFWESVFDTSDEGAMSSLLINQIKAIAAANQAINLANAGTSAAPGKQARFLAEGEQVITGFAIEMDMVIDRVVLLSSIMPDIEKRPRLNPEDESHDADAPAKSDNEPVTSKGSEPAKSSEPEPEKQVDPDELKGVIRRARDKFETIRSAKARVKYDPKLFAKKGPEVPVQPETA